MNEMRLTIELADLLGEWEQTCKQMGLRYTAFDAAAFISSAIAHRVSEPLS